jgi:hypothetical protein
MPGVGRVRGGMDGGPLRGGAPRVVWQTLGADPRTVSARSAAQCLDQHARACHLVWNPLQGEIVQLIPILRAGRSLGWPEELSQTTDETSADEVADLTVAGPGAIDIERLTAGAEQPGRAPAETTAMPVPSGPGQQQRPAAELRDLDGYFDHDEAGATGALSRVG